jgi:5-methyltetrahydropteroyltriglutamate--homocysteine methyltransferase
VNRVIEGIDGIRIGVHVCRGNWSRQEGVHLSGDYGPMLPALTAMQPRQFVLEYSTPRAGDIDVVGRALKDRELGLGVVNPRTAEVETPEQIIAQVESALRYFAPGQVFLNPDCGFGTFAHRCVNDAPTATRKLKAMVRAADTLRARYG